MLCGTENPLKLNIVLGNDGLLTSCNITVGKVTGEHDIENCSAFIYNETGCFLRFFRASSQSALTLASYARLCVDFVTILSQERYKSV